MEKQIRYAVNTEQVPFSKRLISVFFQYLFERTMKTHIPITFVKRIKKKKTNPKRARNGFYFDFSHVSLSIWHSIWAWMDFIIENVHFAFSFYDLVISIFVTEIKKKKKRHNRSQWLNRMCVIYAFVLDLLKVLLRWLRKHNIHNAAKIKSGLNPVDNAFCYFPFTHARTDNCTFKLAAFFSYYFLDDGHNTMWWTFRISFVFQFFFRLFGISDFSISITDTNTMCTFVQCFHRFQ